jgi:hypothetical protein
MAGAADSSLRKAMSFWRITELANASPEVSVHSAWVIRTAG